MNMWNKQARREVTGWASKQKHHYTRRKPGFIYHTFKSKHYQVHFTVRFIHPKMTFQWQQNNASLKKQKHEEEKRENLPKQNSSKLKNVTGA